MKTEEQHCDTGRPLRVLFVNRMAGMIRGGGETFDLEISRHLEKLGVQTSFLTGLPLLGSARIPLNRPRSYAIRTPYTGWFPWDRIRGGWHIRAWDFRVFEKHAVAWAVRHAQEFDVVQVCELGDFVNTWKKMDMPHPVVMRITAPNYYCDPSRGMPQADAVVASGTTIDFLRSGLRPDVHNIPNCVDTDHFRPQVSLLRGKLNVPRNAFVLLYVARFLSFKRHVELLSVFRKLWEQVPRAVLLFAGDGPLESRCREAVRQMGLEKCLFFLGQVAYADLPEVYAAADVKIMASNEHESFGFAALEAMAMALPVVSTACGMIPCLIKQSGGGVVVPVDALDDVIGPLVQYARDPELRTHHGRRNRTMVMREYSWPSSAKLLLDVYKKVTHVNT